MLSCSASTVDRLVERGELEFARRWSEGPKCFTREMVNEYINRLNERGNEFSKRRRK